MQGDLRTATDEAIAGHEDGRALGLLRELLAGAPTIANALFVLDRSRKLRIDRPRVAMRVAILRSFTVEPMLPLLQAAAVLCGLELDFWVGGFNTYPQEMLDPDSDLYRFAPDVVLIAVQTRDVAPELWAPLAELEGGSAVVDRVVQGFHNWVRAFRSRSSAHVIVQNLEQPDTPAAGILDGQLSGSQASRIADINRGLVRVASEARGAYVLDYDGLTARHGRRRWHDERKWLTARMPIASDCLMHMAQEYLRFLLPLAGLTSKVLVVDLDNTLWGGVAAEDGVSSLQCGPEYPAAAYQELQRVIISLHSRGVLLAIASKNNETDALEALDRHPGMLVRSGEFAARRINWNDKVRSLREIATELNVGLDSLALLDDNPVEREQVRRELPEVVVIDLPDDPMHRAMTLRECPFFERLSITKEDRERGRMYAGQAQRTDLQRQAASLEEFLDSLDMEMDMHALSPDGLARVAQLTQKTNQFNLTTRRYSEHELLELRRDPAARIYEVRVHDRFGDNGIVGVAITRNAGAACAIETLLLSCRVIGRTIEQAMLARIAEDAAAAGAITLRGWFLPTTKNQPARGFYAGNGFSIVDRDGEGTLWELDLRKARPTRPEWIRVAEPVA